MSQSPQRPVSTWSRSICRKIPTDKQRYCKDNALWILKQPIRLTRLEKEELLAFFDYPDSAHEYMEDQ